MELIGSLIALVVLYCIGYWTARFLGFALKTGCLILLGLLATSVVLAVVAGLIKAG